MTRLLRSLILAAVACLLAMPVTAAGGQHQPRLGNLTEFSAVAESGNGKVVAAGQTEQCTPIYFGCDGNNKIVVARFTKNGKLDKGFGVGGIVTYAATHDGVHVSGLVIRPGRSIVLSYHTNTGKTGVGLLALTKSGARDASLGGDGTIKIAGYGDPVGFRGAYGPHALLQSGDNLVLAGATENSEGLRFALLGLELDGSPDPAFGANGIDTIDLGAGQEDGTAEALHADGAGDILVVGWAEISGQFPTPVAAKVDSDGDLVAGFGSGGITIYPPNASSTPLGVHATNIFRGVGGQIIAAPAYLDTHCEWMRLTSLMPDGSYPGNAFSTGSDWASGASHCTKMSDAIPAGTGIAAVATKGIDTGQRREAEMQMFRSKAGTYEAGGFRLVPPTKLERSASAVSVQGSGALIVTGWVWASSCRPPFKPGDKCQLGVVSAMKPGGRPLRKFGLGGVAIVPRRDGCREKGTQCP